MPTFDREDARDQPAPWDEPSRLRFYGVDPGSYCNRERDERRAGRGQSWGDMDGDR